MSSYGQFIINWLHLNCIFRIKKDHCVTEDIISVPQRQSNTMVWPDINSIQYVTVKDDNLF